jgi:6-phosphogluconolactonase
MNPSIQTSIRTLAAAAALFAVVRSGSAADTFVYFGTYTGPKSQGIYVSRFDAATGRLSAPELAAATPNPSFLALHPNGRFLYAVNELDEFHGEKAGSVTAFAIDAATGRLSQVSEASTKGTSPCHLSLDRTGRHLFVANYGGGSVAVLPVREDGTLSAATSFIQHTGHGGLKGQEAPHAHDIALDAANRFALVADLGLDKLLVYGFDAAAGTLTAAPVAFAASKPGAGPRHFDFHPGGRLVFSLNELSLTLGSYRYDPATGSLTEILTTSTLPAGVNVTPNLSGAELRVHPSGRFVYASNRGHDSIAVFSVVGDKGTLHAVEVVPTGGKTPRSFTIDPTGAWLLAANQGSDSVIVFRIDPKTGRLSRTDATVTVVAPVCVTFVPARSGP